MLSVRVMVILPDCGHVQRSTVAVVVLDAALSTCPGTTYATSTHLWRGERLGAPSDVGRFFFFDNNVGRLKSQPRGWSIFGASLSSLPPFRPAGMIKHPGGRGATSHRPAPGGSIRVCSSRPSPCGQRHPFGCGLVLDLTSRAPCLPACHRVPSDVGTRKLRFARARACSRPGVGDRKPASQRAPYEDRHRSSVLHSSTGPRRYRGRRARASAAGGYDERNPSGYPHWRTPPRRYGMVAYGFTVFLACTGVRTGYGTSRSKRVCAKCSAHLGVRYELAAAPPPCVVAPPRHGREGWEREGRVVDLPAQKAEEVGHRRR
jgi:hypothetical protein